MANSFNISVKPEIAAAVVKIDAIDSVVDAIRATDVPDIQTNIDANETKIDSNATDLEHIRNTAIPNVITEIDANETKIDTIDGIVDAIKTKTDATPQKVRGVFYCGTFLTVESAFAQALSVTGQGKLFFTAVSCSNPGDTLEFRITIDGNVWKIISHTGDTTGYNVFVRMGLMDETFPALGLIAYPEAEPRITNPEFGTSLLIELRRSAGTASNVRCKWAYSLDTF